MTTPPPRVGAASSAPCEVGRQSRTAPPGFRSGFVTVVGRPNVGKSTLVNRLVGTKVVITSPKPQTTRTTVRGVRNLPTSQLVLLDTPGLHRPRTALGERTNARARATLDEVDVICLVIDATGEVGKGDEFVSELVRSVDTPGLLVVNKIDAVSKAVVASHLAAAAERLGDFEAYVPVSARTGEGVDVLARELEGRLPKGPRYYPEGVITDQPELFLAAELLREQLLLRTHDEVPHSITIEVEELEEDEGVHHPDDVLRLLAIVRVERESQKGIVIGRGGSMLKEAGTAARRELEALLGVRVFLQTTVRVERDWQRRPQALDRLGY